MRILLVLLAALFGASLMLAGCGDDGAPGADTGTPLVDAATDTSIPTDGAADTGAPTDGATDSGMASDGATDGAIPTDGSTDGSTAADASTDGSTMVDAAMDSGATGDAGPSDAATDAADAASDAAVPCHGYAFGAPAVTIASVTSLPPMTGGTIATGTYDAVAFTMIGSGTVSGTFRGTWVFEDATTLQVLQALDLSGGGLPVAVPRSFDYTTAGPMLQRVGACASTTTFNNTYRVTGTTLDLRVGTTMITFERR